LIAKLALQVPARHDQQPGAIAPLAELKATRE
jgi:hypothetical protein